MAERREHIPVGVNRVPVVFPGEGNLVVEVDIDEGSIILPMGTYDVRELHTWFDRITLMLPGEQSIEMRQRAMIATLASYIKYLETTNRELGNYLAMAEDEFARKISEASK